MRRELEDLARTATRCRDCFTNREVVAPAIDVAQPFWVGPKYFSQRCRVVVLMCNPGQSSPKHLLWAKEVRRAICEFRDGKADLRTIMQDPRRMDWASFYIDDLGLSADEVSFANVAWCATKGNVYPPKMLRRCFDWHTSRLLKLLRPNVVLAAGRKAQAFTRGVSDALPKALVMPVLHHAHRKGRAAEQRELDRARSELIAARAEYQHAG